MEASSNPLGLDTEPNLDAEPIGASFLFNQGVEETLDPEDWTQFRSLAHRMLDDMIDFQAEARTVPAWKPVAAEAEAFFSSQVAPRDGLGPEQVYEEFRRYILPYPTGCFHPRFWGWVGGTGTPMGMMADCLAGAMNSNPGIFNDAASRVEHQVVRWMTDALGFPAQSTGILTSGGSVANLVGLAAGRDHILGSETPEVGIAGGPRPRLYASAETHNSILKAAQLLGLGRDAVRLVPVDRRFRIELDALQESIHRDREAGELPFAVVGNAGTVNTGAVDDLTSLARIAMSEGLWFHVDGAFGAMAKLSPELAPLVAGLEEADSVAFDFHKWMYVNYEAGCALIRHPESHRRTFSAPAAYLDVLPRGTGAQPDSAANRGLQLSRGFKALKVWMLIREHGLRRFGRLINQNVAQARYLAGRIREAPQLQLMAPVSLNVVCFRYLPGGLEHAAADRLNMEVLMRIQERGIAIPSSTRIGGRFTLRVAIVNHRSRREDFDALVDAVLILGAELAEEASLRLNDPVDSHRGGGDVPTPLV